MILWSIQDEIAYEKMEKTGALRADENHICEDFFERSYLWMADQMKKRIGPAPDGVVFPVWAWYRWEGKRKRLDMRTHGRRWEEKGTPFVLLTIDVPDECVLLSDFDYWHCVLNDTEIMCPFDETAVYSEEEKRKSWENIFDIECTFDDELRQDFSTQATMWEVKREWVKKVEHFKSR